MFTHKFVIILSTNKPGTISDTIHTKPVFNPPTSDNSYPLYTNLHFNYCSGENLRNYIDYINMFKIDKTLIGTGLMTADVPTLRVSALMRLKSTSPQHPDCNISGSFQ